MNKYRTHKCNELGKEEVDKKISLAGWINKKRDHGNLLFVDLRDNYGITQCIIDKDNKYFSDLPSLHYHKQVFHNLLYILFFWI